MGLSVASPDFLMSDVSLFLVWCHSNRVTVFGIFPVLVACPWTYGITRSGDWRYCPSGDEATCRW